jgi:hypothetical protein
LDENNYNLNNNEIIIKMNSSDYNLLTFKAISNFILELAELFSDDSHSLKLYSRLLKKTTLSHENAIKKHIDAFREFCFKNRDAIITKNSKLFVVSKVEYSDKVFIDFEPIFKDSDTETANVIWKHLLTISALVDPAGKAKEILKNSKDSKEANFLSDLLNKVENNVNPNSNPLEAVSSIMSSGIFTDLISGMNNGIQDGSLDLGKLMGTVQQMCTSIGGVDVNSGAQEGQQPNPMNMLNSMMSSMSQNSENGGGPDLSNLTSLLGPMLSTLSQQNVPPGTVTVEEVEEVKELTNK